MDTEQTEPASERHWRAVALVALAVVVMALAGAAYLQPAPTSHAATPPSPSPDLLVRPGPSSPVAPRSTGLLRDGAISVLLQRYGGLNDPPPLGLLESVQFSNPSEIRLLTRELNALPAYPSGVMFCSDDDESYFAIVFTNAGGTRTTVDVLATGCEGVYIEGLKQPVAWALTSPNLFDYLKGLLADKPIS